MLIEIALGIYGFCWLCELINLQLLRIRINKLEDRIDDLERRLRLLEPEPEQDIPLDTEFREMFNSLRLIPERMRMVGEAFAKSFDPE